MSYASTLLAMYLSHNPLSSRDWAVALASSTRMGCILQELLGGMETKLNNEVDGNGLWVDVLI